MAEDIAGWLIGGWAILVVIAFAGCIRSMGRFQSRK